MLFSVKSLSWLLEPPPPGHCSSLKGTLKGIEQEIKSSDVGVSKSLLLPNHC